MSDEKKSSGLRTRVKMGETTPQDAIKFLLELRDLGHYVKEEVIDWMKRRI